MKVKGMLLSSLVFLCSCTGQPTVNIVDVGYQRAEQQLVSQLKVIPEPEAYPRTVDKDGNLKATHKNDWTEGFYPGCMWYLYEYSGKESWKEEAVKWTEALEPLKKLTNHHDIGFLLYCSFGNGYRLTGDERYKDVLIEAANSLCTRFTETTGCIESWNYRKAWNGVDEWFYPVIIDNMMNLELLYFASKVTGNPFYADIANTHAETTLKNHFRKDYSCYHVINYDETTGNVLHKGTSQGFSDNSAWARGQAWAIYGYTMAYRETQRPEYLEVAVRAADFWLTHTNLPEDKVPYWDFNAGQEGFVPDWNYDPTNFQKIPRDASAAAITASALIELSQYIEDNGRYFKEAENILQSLSSPSYLAEAGTNSNFVLKHSVGSIPHGQEIDVPIVYADYYYLEALLRYNEFMKNKTT